MHSLVKSKRWESQRGCLFYKYESETSTKTVASTAYLEIARGQAPRQRFGLRRDEYM
jgi:hypothetical protein